MKFINCKDRLPEPEQIVLVKLIDNDIPYYICAYTVCYSDPEDGNKYAFREASGEHYMCYDISEVKCWLPIEELNEIEEWNL